MALAMDQTPWPLTMVNTAISSGPLASKYPVTGRLEFAVPRVNDEIPNCESSTFQVAVLGW
jgi:hypothetical protein